MTKRIHPQVYLRLYAAFLVLWLISCGSAAPFEKAHYSTTVGNPGSGPAVFKAEVPKGYQAFLESRNGNTATRWDYIYNDSSRFYIAPIPERIMQKAVASTEKASAPAPMAQDTLSGSGQDAAGLYWMERQVAGVRVGYRNVPHGRLYLFNYAVESFQAKK